MEVTLLDTFGSDLTVVNAARVSFAKESKDMLYYIYDKDMTLQVQRKVIIQQELKTALRNN
jgi:hypothetical protein